MSGQGVIMVDGRNYVETFCHLSDRANGDQLVRNVVVCSPLCVDEVPVAAVGWTNLSDAQTVIELTIFLAGYQLKQLGYTNPEKTT